MAKREYESEKYRVQHKDYGELEVEILLDKKGIIAQSVEQVLTTKHFKSSLWLGALKAELTHHSQLRVKSIRRLTGKKKTS